MAKVLTLAQFQAGLTGLLGSLKSYMESYVDAAVLSAELDAESGMSAEARSALLDCLRHVAWLSAEGSAYYAALEAALNSVEEEGGDDSGQNSGESGDNGDSGEDPGTATPTVYTVTNHLTNCVSSNAASAVTEGSAYSATVSADAGYNLSALTVTMGGADVTATVCSGGAITIAAVTGNIVVTATATGQVTLTGLNAVFTQGGAVIYDTDSLETLRSYLTVTAVYSDNSTAAVADYTLSGSLAAPGSTVTASYGGQTAGFTVTVTPTVYTVTNGLTNCTSSNAASTVAAGSAYSAVITLNAGHTLYSLTVTMGGTDITASAYSEGTVSVAAVTGDLTITAAAVQYAFVHNMTVSQTSTTVGGAATTASGTRISYLGDYGEYPLSSSNDSYTASGYYLHPIPAGTASVTITIPSGYYFGLTAWQPNEAGRLVRVLDVGWLQNSQTYSLASYNDGSCFLGVNFKNASNSSVAGDDTSEWSVVLN